MSVEMNLLNAEKCTNYISEDPIFDLENTKYGQFLQSDKSIYEGHKRLKDAFIQIDLEERKEKKESLKTDLKYSRSPKSETSCCKFIQQFLFFYWHLLLFMIILSLILITSVIFYSFCQQQTRSNSSRPATPTVITKLEVTTSNSNPTTYFPARLDKYQTSADKINADHDQECPLNFYVILIILSSVGLVLAVVLGVGASFLNQ